MTQCPRRRHCTLLLKTLHQGQTAIKNGSITELTSVVMDLVAVKVKAKVSAALHHVSEAESALHNMECPSQRLAGSLMKARQTLKEG